MYCALDLAPDCLCMNTGSHGHRNASMPFSFQVKFVTSFQRKKIPDPFRVLLALLSPNFPCSTHTGDQMVFFLLNIIELVGLLLTFKPFLAVPERFDST